MQLGQALACVDQFPDRVREDGTTIQGLIPQLTDACGDGWRTLCAEGSRSAYCQYLGERYTKLQEKYGKEVEVGRRKCKPLSDEVANMGNAIKMATPTNAAVPFQGTLTRILKQHQATQLQQHAKDWRIATSTRSTSE